MELRHLRYFVTAAEELNISRASARLRVSQPAVSRQIHDLEEELGVALFKREKTGLSLTPAGAGYLAHARDILRKSAQAVAHMDTFRTAPARKLTIGYIAPVLASMLTPALAAFSRKHTDLDVILKELSPQDQIKALREGRLDLALPGNPCPELASEFAVKILRRIPFFAVLPEDHPLAGRKRIGLVELRSDVFVGFDEDSFPGRNASICDACQQAGFTPQLRRRVGSLSALLATVASGKGVTLTPEEVGQLPHPGAVIVALKPPVPSVASAAVFQKGQSNGDITELLSLCKKAS